VDELPRWRNVAELEHIGGVAHQRDLSNDGGEKAGVAGVLLPTTTHQPVWHYEFLTATANQQFLRRWCKTEQQKRCITSSRDKKAPQRMVQRERERQTSEVKII
jgi:hypothetical protein